MNPKPPPDDVDYGCLGESNLVDDEALDELEAKRKEREMEEYRIYFPRYIEQDADE